MEFGKEAGRTSITSAVRLELSSKLKMGLALPRLGMSMYVGEVGWGGGRR
jgi:hypothetical protein